MLNDPGEMVLPEAGISPILYFIIQNSEAKRLHQIVNIQLIGG